MFFLIIILLILFSPRIYSYFFRLDGKGLPRSKNKSNEKKYYEPPGDFTNLSFGETHYIYRGPKEGPIIILIHGFSASSRTFQHYVDKLSEQG